MSSPESSAENPPRPEFMKLLELMPPYTLSDVEQAYKEKAKDYHPDHGGDTKQFLKLQDAYDKARAHAAFRQNRMGWIGTQMERYVEQQKAVETLERLGGKIQVEQIDWLKRSFGDDFAQLTEKVIALTVRGRHVDDSVIDYLVQQQDSLVGLQSLDLAETSVTDQGIWRLHIFRSLQHLNLRDTSISMLGLELLRWLPELNWIHLGDTKVGMLQRQKLGWKYRALTIETNRDAQPPPLKS